MSALGHLRPQATAAKSLLSSITSSGQRSLGRRQLMLQARTTEISPPRIQISVWSKTAIDPLAAARGLWLETHPALGAPIGNAAS